jgi:hypothetical protein
MTGRCLCLLLLFICAVNVGYAQSPDANFTKLDSAKKDTVFHTTDSLRVESSGPVQDITSYAAKFNPRRAILLAAVFPGSGQVYTRKYWKVPLVYGGFGILIYATVFYQGIYTKYKGELFQTINYPNVPLASGLQLPQLRTIVDEARRQRDYFLIINFFWYILQMVDAHVDAHLKEFDLNPKLQVRLDPQGGVNGMMGRSTGVGLVFKF